MKKFIFSRFALCVLCGAALFVLLPASLSQAQQKWTRTYGGTGSDYGYSVQQTSDGGYIVAGQYNGAQLYLIKTNASGDTLWTRTYASGVVGYSVQQTSDSGYIVVGQAYRGMYGYCVHLIKTNASGDTLWTKDLWGGTCGYSVQQTSDGGYIVAGYVSDILNYPDVYIVKTNYRGDNLWDRHYGGSNSDYGYSVRQTTDGDYIIAGVYQNTSENDVYLIKIDPGGVYLWGHQYGGSGNEIGYSVKQTSEGGYIVVGSTSSFGYNGDVYLIKTNASGDTLWTKHHGGISGDVGYSVQQTSDGGYIIAGYTNSFGLGLSDVYLIKTNASGDSLWTRTYGGISTDEGHSVQQTSDGGYIIAGYTNFFGAGGYDVYLIKTDANGNVGVQDKGISSPVSRLPFTVRPNPFTSFASVPGHSSERFILYDISGRMVGTYLGNRIGEGLAPGVYFVRGQASTSAPLRTVKVR